MTSQGLITVRSAYAVRETIDRLEHTARSRGLSVFARVDHAEGAAQVGMVLRPTELVLFGHPRGGTPLMQDRQSAGLDLPLRALAWEDAEGRVWLVADDPAWLAQRHGLGAASAPALAALEAVLAAVMRAAAGQAEGDESGLAPAQA